jgi:uncharacterized protein
MEMACNERGIMVLNLKILPGRYAVCRLSPNSALPEWAIFGSLRSVSWTPDETSIVCDESAVPEEVKSEPGWRGFMVEGPLSFGLTGILLMLAEPLAKAGISIFALSTYDTDYVLVKDASFSEAKQILAACGHSIQ